MERIKCCKFKCNLRDLFEGPAHGLVGRVFANDSGDLDSIPGRRHTRDFKNSTWYLLAIYKVRIKDKVEQSRKRISALR